MYPTPETSTTTYRSSLKVTVPLSWEIMAVMIAEFAFLSDICYDVFTFQYIDMPITSSAKKALRNSARKRIFNMRKKDSLQVAFKKLRKLVADKDKKGAEKFMSNIQKILDKSAKTGLLKENTASRKKSRLSAMIRKMA